MCTWDSWCVEFWWSRSVDWRWDGKFEIYNHISSLKVLMAFYCNWGLSTHLFAYKNIICFFLPGADSTWRYTWPRWRWTCNFIFVEVTRYPGKSPRWGSFPGLFVFSHILHLAICWLLIFLSLLLKLGHCSFHTVQFSDYFGDLNNICWTCNLICVHVMSVIIGQWESWNNECRGGLQIRW